MRLLQPFSFWPWGLTALASLGFLALDAFAQQPPQEVDVPARLASERQRLQAERSGIEQKHEASMRACWQRFAVNDCLREARRQRHAALDPLRAQELELNAQERAWRSGQREERLRGKSADQEGKP